MLPRHGSLNVSIGLRSVWGEWGHHESFLRYQDPSRRGSPRCRHDFPEFPAVNRSPATTNGDSPMSLCTQFGGLSFLKPHAKVGGFALTESPCSYCTSPSHVRRHSIPCRFPAASSLASIVRRLLVRQILAWLLRHPAKIVPVLGTNNLERIKTAADALRVTMDRQTWFELYTLAIGKEVA